MKKEIREYVPIQRLESMVVPVYCNSNDMTILIRTVRNSDSVLKTEEIVGFHYGKPDENSKNFIGKMKAEF